MITILADLPDISKVPADFTQWYIILTGFFVLLAIQVFNTGFNVWNARQTKKTEITGKIDSTQQPQHAEKAELHALAATVNALRVESEHRAKTMHAENLENMKAIREENAALHRHAQVSGENRVMAITADVNSKMDSLGGKVGELAKLISTALIDNAAQGAEIKGLQGSIHRHDAEVRAIQERIADLIKAGANKRSASKS